MIWFQGIKNITDALAAKGLLKDTLIVFTTDNGGWPCAGAHHIASHLISLLLPLTCSLLQAAPTCHYGRYSCSQVNMPTQHARSGSKMTVWEGGVRGNAFIAGAGLPTHLQASSTSHHIISHHVTCTGHT